MEGVSAVMGSLQHFPTMSNTPGGTVHPPQAPNNPPDRAATQPSTYSEAAKRNLPETTDEGSGDEGRMSLDDETDDVPLEEPSNLPGPIKGFNANNVFYNLLGEVQAAWEEKADEAIFIHYLNGSYSPTMALEVHTVRKDLCRKHA